MPKTESPPVPLSMEDRDELLRVLREASEPLEAAKVGKLANTSRRPTSDETAAILQEFVEVGDLKAWPAKTVKGKPRFWNRDLKSIGEAALADLVRQSSEPLTAKEANKLCKLPSKLSDPETVSILMNLAQRGVIYEIPAKTAKSGVRYWNHDAEQFGRDCLLTQIRGQPPQTKVKLKGAVKWLDQTRFEELLQQLTNRGEIYQHPPLGKSAQSLWSRSPPAPELYLKSIRDQLATVVSKLQSASVPQADLRRAAVQMLESVGISFGTAPSVCAQVTSGRREEAVDLVQLMQAIEPGAERGALVTARMLRNAAKLSKPAFDALALQLSREGRIALHEHDFVASLSPEDRDELVTDGQGHFYVGMALRLRQGKA